VTTTQGWDAAGLRSATDLNGWLLYGELINNTGTTRQVISIGGMFYDAGGALLADSLDAFIRTPTNLVPAGGRLPFELSLVGIESVAAYTLSVNAQVHPANPRQDFLFTNIAQTYARDRLCTTADFRNPGADLTLSLEIAAVLFDDVDRVINVSDAETPDLADVAGGRTLNVQVCIDPPNQNVSRLDWRAWGR
jgi:hypothetical protein